ncbi:uncharacterized protein BYT42DRAFT_582465 [Radiomyces spectabilis]|uniref:uncharacterized protein n=1 Tax=Radiomyces spectabilis TaxID=64574 RepID=UPI00221E3A76|nr:uncharacterized protein BYT42DRAFT_582465 [Radiomyces spectabilis]KAI8370447.1 hypothetical protein BYT42DRAFT_582465 [Radiomyces spectabilis]
MTMAAMIQHTPVMLRQQQDKEDEDVALATYLTSNMRFDKPQDVWSYQQQQSMNWQRQQQQQQQQQQYAYYQNSKHTRTSQRPSRARTPSNPGRDVLPMQKSNSTPLPSQVPSSGSNHPRSKPQASSPRSTDPMRRSRLISESSRPPLSYPRNSSSSSSVIISDNGGGVRRSSITSVASSTVSQTVSIRSEMSVNTKLSLSRRLRKVFSMGNLRSSKDLGALRERNTSSTSVVTADVDAASVKSVDVRNPNSFRRRSLASLSNLFHHHGKTSSVAEPEVSTSQKIGATNKGNSLPRPISSGDLRDLAARSKSDDKKDRPALRVDTDEAITKSRKNASKGSGRPVAAPDSPNSAISSRSYRLPPPAHQSHRLMHPELPSPTPSSSSSSSQRPRLPSLTQEDEMIPPPAVGLHYGLPLHGSPRLKPAHSSSSSLVESIPKRRIQFCTTIQVHETFAASEYDRRCDPNATCQKLSPLVAMKIKQELNEYKLTDMEVHVESRQYTHFFL